MTARSQKEELASQIRQKINVGASAKSSARYIAPSLRPMASRQPTYRFAVANSIL
jgi:hypothetical protein